MTTYSQDCVTLVVEKLVTVADFKRQPIIIIIKTLFYEGNT